MIKPTNILVINIGQSSSIGFTLCCYVELTRRRDSRNSLSTVRAILPTYTVVCGFSIAATGGTTGLANGVTTEGMTWTPRIGGLGIWGITTIAGSGRGGKSGQTKVWYGPG